MKTLFTTLFLALMSTPAFAIDRVDNSMTLVYGFLGMCGLIIFLQILPVLAIGYGIVKGLFGNAHQADKNL